MSKITDYGFLFQQMFGTKGTKSTSAIGSFQLSQLNSSSIQSQLKAAGIDTNSAQYKAVDPRSYKDREIPLIPTIHLGERASALERKGIRTERGNINRAIEKYNAMIMKIYGFISELKEELKKGVFRFVFERKSRTERDDIQSINPSINPSVPEQKSEVQTALEILQKQRTEMVVRPIFPYVLTSSRS